MWSKGRPHSLLVRKQGGNSILGTVLWDPTKANTDVIQKVLSLVNIKMNSKLTHTKPAQ